ncbi:MAG: hypothetical protein ACYC19_10250 [Acidimicrobiales bacterium]
MAHATNASLIAHNAQHIPTKESSARDLRDELFSDQDPTKHERLA